MPVIKLCYTPQIACRVFANLWARGMFGVSLACFAFLANAEPRCESLVVGGGDWVLAGRADPQAKTAAGINLQVLQLIEQSLGIAIAFGPSAPFARQLQQLQSGHLDMVMGVLPVGERLERFDFSPVYHEDAVYVFGKADFMQQYTGLTSLQGKRGVVVRGASYGAALDNLYRQSTDDLMTVNKQKQRADLVRSGRADYFVSTLSAAGLKTGDGLVASSEPITATRLAIAFSRESRCAQVWRDDIARVLKEEYGATPL